MRKTSLVLLATLLLSLGLSGCQIKTVDNSIAEGIAGDYSGMRDNTEVFDASEEKENINRGVYKDGIKGNVLAEAVPEYPTEPPETTEAESNKSSTTETTAGTTHVIGNYYDDGKKKNNNSSTSTTKASNETKAPDNNTNHGNNNTSSVNTSTVGSNTEDKDKNNSSTDDNDSPEKRKNPASMVINGSKYNVYITIEGYYRGNKALRKLNSYNSKHAVEYNMDIPDGYEPVIVQFTVTADDDIPNEEDTLIPEIRVKDASGKSFDEYPTFVSVLRMGDYSDESSSTKSYDAVFEMPDSSEGFQMIFGSSTGNTYRFKSSQLDGNAGEE